MAQNFIAVKRGKVDNVIFVCNGANRCHWYAHVWPLIEGTSRQEFMGFKTFASAKRYVGETATVAWRQEAEQMLASAA